MKKIKIIALIGKAGSGKDYWLKRICEEIGGVHEIISCTTRPARFGEEDDVNYHFLTDEQFLSQSFLESCMFRGWRYGTRLSDLNPDEVNIGVFNLTGIENLLKNPQIDLTIIHLKAPDNIRLIRQLERTGTNYDIEEIFRRYKTDNEDFSEERLKNIRNQVNGYSVIVNGEYADNQTNLIYLMSIIGKVKSK